MDLIMCSKNSDSGIELSINYTSKHIHRIELISQCVQEEQNFHDLIVLQLLRIIHWNNKR